MEEIILESGEAEGCAFGKERHLGANMGNLKLGLCHGEVEMGYKLKNYEKRTQEVEGMMRTRKGERKVSKWEGLGSGRGTCK